MSHRRRSRFPALAVLAWIAFAVPASAADFAVDLKNDDAFAVSVPAGTDNGVTRDNDFRVTGDGVSVTIYPAELYNGRFWSQPLPEAAYPRIKAGMAVVPATLGREDHARVRAEGDARKAELRRVKEEARREAARRQSAELEEKRSRLDGQRDALEDRIAAAEKSVADEESRMDWLMRSNDDDIDRSLQRILELADRRDELQAQREAVSRGARSDVGRLTAQIQSLNGQIDSERTNIRNARDRKRRARSSYQEVVREWKKLVAERNGLVAEITSIDRKIRDLSGR